MSDLLVTEKNYCSVSPVLSEMSQKRSCWSWSKSYISIDHSGTISIVALNLFERLLRVLLGCVDQYRNTQLEIVRSRIKECDTTKPHVKAILAAVNQIWAKSYPNEAALQSKLPASTSQQSSSTALVPVAASAEKASPMVRFAFPRRNLVLACADQKVFFGQRVFELIGTNSQRQLFQVHPDLWKLRKDALFCKMGNPFASVSLDTRISLLKGNVEFYRNALKVWQGGGSGDTTRVWFSRLGELGPAFDPKTSLDVLIGSRNGRGMCNRAKPKELPAFSALQTRVLSATATGEIDPDSITPEFFVALFDLMALTGLQDASVGSGDQVVDAHFNANFPKYVAILKSQKDMPYPTIESLKALIDVAGNKVLAS